MAATPVFSLGGPAAGDYSYAYKPGGVDYFRGTTPITNAQYNSAQFLAGQGPRAEEIEAKAPPATPPTGPGNSNGGSGTTYSDKSNDISLQNAGLGAVDTQTTAGTAAVDTALGKLNGQYDTEAATNTKTYQTNSDQNQNNLQRNKQTALVNAAQGRRGLLGTLSSLGALGGSGITLANEAVQKGANEDLSGAGDTYATNQTGLDTAINAFKQQDKERRDNAVTAAGDAKTNIQNEAAKNKQTFYSNLAKDYADQGDSSNAAKFTKMAADLFPSIASTSVPSTNLGYTAAAFNSPSLANYLAGANSTQVKTTPATGSGNSAGTLPGLIATPAKKQLQVA